MNNHPTPSDNHSQLSALGSRLFAVKAVRVWTVIAIFFIGLFLASVGIMLTGSSTRGQLLASALVQDLFAFALPAFLGGWLFTGRPWQWAGLSRPAPALSLMGVVSVFIVSIPLLNYTVALNEALELPDFLSGLEVTIRRLEDQAAATTSLLLGDPSVWGLVSGITIIGVIGPFCEELFFRGALQKSLYGPHPWKAVWWAAAIFSFVHFQMYGFLPRFLLGLWFGYLYLWTGRLWPSVLAHALNNTATVVTQWLVLRGVADPSLFDIGSGGNPVVIIITAAITTLAVWGMWRLYGRKRHG